MLDSFISYCKNVIGVDNTSKVLLTVSGGVDSMVMFELFKRAGFDFAVAHCNFQLRGDESERDMEFVQKSCDDAGIVLYVKCFATASYAAQKGISIQMAARELRYDWFEKLRSDGDFDFIATAHHLDDQAETFFINLIRGTGIAGLHGIKPVNGKIIRPLMFATRHDIMQFASQNNIDFVEDTSNFSDKYLRNHLRHNIIPLFNALNQHFITNLARTIDNIAAIENEFKSYSKLIFNRMLKLEGNKIIIDISELTKIDNLKLYLAEFLSQYGFNDNSIKNIYESLTTDKSGLRFFSEEYRLLKNRNELIINPLENGNDDSSNEFYLIDNDFNTELPVNLNFTLTEDTTEFKSSSAFAYFDFHKLNFPLVLRKWKKGDFFYPFGMKGKKLVSDYFTDNKFSLADKEETWLLCSGEDIVWIVGHRSDNRFKVDKNTKKTLIVELKNGTY